MTSGLLLAGVAVLFPPSASAQVGRTVGEVVRAYRDAPANSYVRSILSQREPGFTAADRDALADSLVRMALSGNRVVSRHACLDPT